MKPLLGLLLFLCGVAHAQCTTWVYTGAPVTLISSGNGAPTLPNALTGVVMLTEPLPLNGTTTATLAAFDFSALYQNILTNPIYPNGYDGVPPTFIFTTINGIITGWSANLTYAYGYYDKSSENTYTLNFTLSSQGDSVTAYENIVANGMSGTTSGSNTTAGSWACAITAQSQLTAAQAALIADQAQVTALTAQVTTLTAQVASLKTQLAAQTPATSAPSPVVAATPVMIAGTKGGGAFSWLTLLLWGAIPLTVRLRDRLRSG